VEVEVEVGVGVARGGRCSHPNNEETTKEAASQGICSPLLKTEHQDWHCSSQATINTVLFSHRTLSVEGVEGCLLSGQSKSLLKRSTLVECSFFYW